MIHKCSCCRELAECIKEKDMSTGLPYYRCQKCEQYFKILLRKDKEKEERRLKEFRKKRDELLKRED